jgi:hypothetical protein
VRVVNDASQIAPAYTSSQLTSHLHSLGLPSMVGSNEATVAAREVTPEDRSQCVAQIVTFLRRPLPFSFWFRFAC